MSVIKRSCHEHAGAAMGPTSSDESCDVAVGLVRRSGGGSPLGVRATTPVGRRADPTGGRCEDQDREAIHSAAAAGASWDGTSTSGAIGSSENRSPVRACEMPVVRTMVRPVYSGYS